MSASEGATPTASGGPGPVSMYERAGGRPFFEGLVDRFYRGVEEDPILRPLYPESLEGPKEHLTDFLVQYWGGPPDYSTMRGHPRLRMRHARFEIGPAERDAWLARMTTAVKAGGLSEADETEMLSYFEYAANFLLNRA